tara:strand:+ start:294 stop:782 length:489 start_codon:yes stop_codon:yes gene_type:complete
MAGFYSGQDGQLFIDDNIAVKIRSWSFTANQSVLETVTLEDRDRTIIPGVRSITGSASFYYYQSSPGSGNADTTVLLNNLVKGSPIAATSTINGVTINTGASTTAKSGTVKLKLKILDGTTAGRFLEFHAIITSLSMTCAVGEVLSADINFEANGAVTEIVM